jgi:hypothetical protein
MLNIELFNMIKKSLKIPNELSDSVNRKRTDNTIDKRKKNPKGQTTITHKTKDRIARTPFKAGSNLKCS